MEIVQISLQKKWLLTAENEMALKGEVVYLVTCPPACLASINLGGFIFIKGPSWAQ
jgi:hypothetical protein